MEENETLTKTYFCDALTVEISHLQQEKNMLTLVLLFFLIPLSKSTAVFP